MQMKVGTRRLQGKVLIATRPWNTVATHAVTKDTSTPNITLASVHLGTTSADLSSLHGISCMEKLSFKKHVTRLIHWLRESDGSRWTRKRTFFAESENRSTDYEISIYPQRNSPFCLRSRRRYRLLNSYCTYKLMSESHYIACLMHISATVCHYAFSLTYYYIISPLSDPFNNTWSSIEIVWSFVDSIFLMDPYFKNLSKKLHTSNNLYFYCGNLNMLFP